MVKLAIDAKKGIVQSKGNGIEFSGLETAGGTCKIIEHSAGETTLSPLDSGAIIAVKANDAGGKILLPAVAASAGVWFEVVIQAEIGNNLVIEAVGDEVQVLFNVNADDNAVTRTAADDLTVTAAGDAIGDRLSYFSDGVNWYVEGVSAVGATFAVA